MTMTSANSQPSSAWGPPIAVISSGIVMNGPIPTMLDMLSAVACSRPNRRSSDGVLIYSDNPARYFKLSGICSTGVGDSSSM